MGREGGTMTVSICNKRNQQQVGHLSCSMAQRNAESMHPCTYHNRHTLKIHGRAHPQLRWVGPNLPLEGGGNPQVCALFACKYARSILNAYRRLAELDEHSHKSRAQSLASLGSLRFTRSWHCYHMERRIRDILCT